MMQEEENPNEEPEYKTVTMKGLNKALAILFVFAIYFLIFLKLLFLK
jgi:hypothetical protein